MAPSASSQPAPISFDSPEYDALHQQKTQTTPEVQAEQVARECLEDIMHRFHLVLHEHEAHRRTVVSAVESCLATALDVIEMQYPAREDNPVSVISLEHNSWEQEKPPDPCSFDSWLRSALPETAPSGAGTSNRGDSWVMQQFLMKQPSIHRSPSQRSNPDLDAAAAAAVAAVGGAPTPPPTDRGGGGGGTSRVAYAPGTSTSAASVPSSAKGIAGSSTRSLQTNNSRRVVTKLETKKQLTPEQEHLEEQLRQELQQRKTQEEMSRRLEQKDAEERSKLASLRKELKGKDYTYDHKGEVVILNEFDPDRTPLEALSGPAFKVAAPEEALRTISPKRRNTLRSLSMRSATAAAAEAAAAASARQTLSPTEMRKERDRRLANDFKKMNPKTQPSALETLMPAGGVTLRGAGGATKSGPLRPVGTGITREAYAKQVAKKAMQAAAEAGGGYPPLTPLSIPAGTPPGGPVSTRSHRHASMAPGAAGGGGGGGGAKIFMHSASGTAAAVAAARAALTSPPSNDPLAAYGDNKFDPFAGARARPRSQQGPGLLAGLHAGGGGSAGHGHPRAGDVSASSSVPDINLSLTSAGDWGAAGNGKVYEAPMSLPRSKPTEKQLAETVGRVERLPRERAPLPTLAPPLSPLKAGAQKPPDRLQFHSILAE